MWIRRLGFLVLVVAGCLAVSPSAQAQTLVNGGFETGNFAGWTTIGQTSVISNLGPVTPPQGNFMAFLSTGGAAQSEAAVAASLGISPLLLPYAGGGGVASAISQLVTVNPGDFVTFNWKFLTNEATPTFFNDSSFFGVAPVLGGTPVLLANTTSGGFVGAGGTGFSEMTPAGFASTTFTFGVGGTFRIGFSVGDVGDSIVDSGLLVDNVVVSPEPGSLVLFGLAGLGVAAYRRRQKRTV